MPDEAEELRELHDDGVIAKVKGDPGKRLVAYVCVLAAKGELEAWTTPGDDKHSPLFFRRPGHTATLVVQVKTREADSDGLQKGRFKIFVRAETFSVRADTDVLFAAVDIAERTLEHTWLVPSTEFQSVSGEPNKVGKLRFSASAEYAVDDKWRPYRLAPEELAAKILSRLDALEASGQ